MPQCQRCHKPFTYRGYHGAKLCRKCWIQEDVHKNENNPGWKGENVSNSGLHKWVSRNKIKQNKCSECGTITAKRYHWANISQEYKRDLDDFRELCTSCNIKESFEFGAVVWNKGTKGLVKPNKTSFKKGHTLNRGKYRVENPSYQTLYMREYRKRQLET